MSRKHSKSQMKLCQPTNQRVHHLNLFLGRGNFRKVHIGSNSRKSPHKHKVGNVKNTKHPHSVNQKRRCLGTVNRSAFDLRLRRVLFQGVGNVRPKSEERKINNDPDFHRVKIATGIDPGGIDLEGFYENKFVLYHPRKKSHQPI